jgi:transposase-like protein
MDINNNLVIDRRREKKRIRCIMIIDETMITIKDEVYWLWVACIYMNLIQRSIY